MLGQYILDALAPGEASFCVGHTHAVVVIVLGIVVLLAAVGDRSNKERTSTSPGCYIVLRSERDEYL